MRSRYEHLRKEGDAMEAYMRAYEFALDELGLDHSLVVALVHSKDGGSSRWCGRYIRFRPA